MQGRGSLVRKEANDKERGAHMCHILIFIPLLALALFLFLPWHVALLLYLAFAIVALAIARKVVQAQRQPRASGEEAMIGGRAVVVSMGTRFVEVQYQGEIWRAVSSQALHLGQQVIIDNAKGLTLQVSPLPQSSDDEPTELEGGEDV
jgi:membrane protein implicated in regulation of membrane protease activity